MTKKKKIVKSGLSVIVTVSSFNVGMISLAVALENNDLLKSPLIISEIVADTHQSDKVTASGTDAYEYIEIFNTSQQAICMDDYLIRNMNGTTATDWNIPEGTVIEAGKSLVVWVQNAEAILVDIDDFCQYYGIDKDQVNIVKTTAPVNGFSNTGTRSMQLLVKNTGQIIAQITYNDATEKAQTKKGITFQYNNGKVQETTLSYDEVPTPGQLIDSQKVEGNYVVEKNNNATISIDALKNVDLGSSLDISASTDLSSIVLNAYVQLNDKQYSMTYNNNQFIAKIPASDFTELKDYSYTVHISDGVNQLEKSDSFTVKEASQKELSSPIVISEIVPNTANISGSDGYEYFEIYNTTDRKIDLNQYKFVYVNGTKETEWKLSHPSIQLEGHQTLTVWVKNTANIDIPVEDFNKQFGTELVYGTNLTTTAEAVSGFSNSGTRQMRIYSQTGLLLNTVEYNAADSSDGKLGENETIYYTYDGDVVTTHYDEIVSSVGKQNEGQTVNGDYIFPEKIDNPTINADSSTIAKRDEDYQITISSTNLTNPILNATVDVYDDSKKLVYTLPMTYDNDQLTCQIPSTQLNQLSSITYEINATDGINEAKYQSHVISIEDLSADKSLAPALTITELLPDSQNISGSDAYEYIEIYNNSSKDINLKDYKLYYSYPDNGDNSDVIWWDTDEDKILKAHETLVFWIKNGKNDTLTLSDFNNKFNVSLTSDQLIEIQCAGMANSGARGIKIASNVKDVIDYVQYNMNGADNTNADQSITFQNVYQNQQFSSHLVNDKSIPTPGTVTEETKPHYEAQLPEDSTLEVEDQTLDSFNEEENFAFSIKATSSNTTVKTVKLYLKDNFSDEYDIYNLLRENGDIFSKDFNSVDLYGKQYYEYYFEVSDGYHVEKTQPMKIINQQSSQKSSINVTEGSILSQTQQVIGLEQPLKIDGQEISTVRSINGNAKIAFDTTQTDVFFKNAVAIGQNILGVFNEGTYDQWRTYAYNVDASYFDYDNKQVTIAFHAGNKANALEHDIENNDDFVLKNIRLVLPDGQSLKPIAYKGVKGIGAIEHNESNWKPDDPQILTGISQDTQINMGDGTSKIEILYVTFQLNENNFNAYRYALDTTQFEDGDHILSSGNETVHIKIDNTAPEISVNIEDGQLYHSTTIEAQVKDAICQNTTLIAKLDGKVITLPYSISSLELKAGEHTLELQASDEVGNISSKTVVFKTPEENPIAQNVTPNDGTTLRNDPTLSLKVTDLTNDKMTVSFKKGERYELGDSQITQSQGVSNTSGKNDSSFDPNSKNGFPYQQFDIQIDKDYQPTDVIQVNWEGQSNNDKTMMYVYNYQSQSWDKVNTTKTIHDDNIQLIGEITLENYVQNSKVKIMIQNGEGYTPQQYGKNEYQDSSLCNPNETPRNQYDFTFAIESDTQYYNEDYVGNPNKDVNGKYQYQLDIHEWLLKNQKRMNIQYLFHNGDIIDDEPLIPEWENADAAYKLLDNASFPYGVLAGNHDVGHLSGDYTNYCKYFGENRYNQNPWYGGSYKNNRAHYDLITVDGIDFIMMYVGWGIGDEEIQWMNDVLAQYPERKAILNFHEYLLASGGLGEEPQRVHDEVVAKNPNVCMVLSGHYHNAQTKIESFDDNHDGVNDRTVYQMLFNYQGLNEGGMGYMRLMHFDVDNGQIIIRTYSPSLDDYNAKDEKDIGNVDGINGEEEFVIPFADLGIEPKQKSLSTSSLQVNLYTDQVIQTFEDVKSGDVVSYLWQNIDNDKYGWYAEIKDENNAITRTPVQYLTVEKETQPIITVPSYTTINKGTSFDAMKDVSAKDYLGQDITNNLTVEGHVDTSLSGTYTLTYKVMDDYGHVSQIVRNITVIDDKLDVDSTPIIKPTNPIQTKPNIEYTENGNHNIQIADKGHSHVSTAVNTSDQTKLVGHFTIFVTSLLSIMILLKKKWKHWFTQLGTYKKMK